MTQENPPKDWQTTLLLCIFTGGVSGHRWYTGYKGSAIAQLLTAGGCMVWWIMDLIKILNGTFVDAQGRPLVKK